MRKSQWGLALLLIAVMTVTNIVPAFAAKSTENMPGYIIDGEVSDSTFTARIYLQGANATAGSIALKFDTTKLELANDSTLAGAVSAGTGVTITTNSLSHEQTVSQEDGRVLIAWYPSGTRLNALEENMLVCSVPFNFKAGITESDLDAASLRMYDLRNGEFSGWESGATIFADITHLGGEYVAEICKYNTYSSPLCYVKTVYPGSDRTPAAAHKVTFDAKDILGQQVEAKIMVNGCLYETDTQNQVTLYLVDGTYSYQVITDELDLVVTTFTVDGADKTVELSLKNNRLLAQQAANNLKITYAEGDSAERVTRSVKLPLSAGNKIYVLWTSDKPEVIANNGTLTPVTEVTTVVLNAAVTKNSDTVQREFTLTVVPEGYTGETPDPGEGETPDPGEGETPDPGTSETPGTGNTGNTGNTGTQKPDNTEDKDETPNIKNFTDLDAYGWAADAIHALAQKGIINGVTETTFNPGGSITRADFTCLLMRMLLPEGELAGEGFSDVAQDAYYYSEVMRAKMLGIVTGSTDGKFNPADNITRQDMILITYRALEALGKIETQQSSDVLDTFTDGGSTQEYARLGVAAAVENKWIQGAGNNELQPMRNCTRAEAAVFIDRINNK